MAKATERSSVYRGGSSTVFALFNESIRRGYTYTKIGELVGVGRSTVASWWSGDREPGVRNVEKWATAMGGFLVFSMPAEVAAPRLPKFRPQMDEWSRESRGKVPYAGREDVV